MKLAVTMLLALFFVGCSTQEPRPETRSAVSTIERPRPTQAPEEVVSSINYELADSLETRLILSFWLHLDKERERLQEVLEGPLVEKDRKTIQKFLGMLQEQQKAVWQTLFDVEGE
jgi:uncharacterized protein with NRDE domain